MAKYSLYINSDCSLIIEFEGEISLELSRFILGAKLAIEKASLEGFVEAVPAYNSLLLIFEPKAFQVERLLQETKELLDKTESLAPSQSTRHDIPVCYHESLAPDLAYVANHAGIPTEELIKLHSQTEYPVYMLGFLPGFLYLGNLNKALYCPRRENPRPRVDAGSVAIGGDQTGVYPIASPGGWHIIGKTPISMLDSSRQNPAIAKPLDTIIFKPISLEEFNQYDH